MSGSGDRVIAIELSTPEGIHTLMIARLYGIKGWGCFSHQIRVIPPSDQISEISEDHILDQEANQALY